MIVLPERAPDALLADKGDAADAFRYDQLASSFLGKAYLAAARHWLKFVHAAEVGLSIEGTKPIAAAFNLGMNKERA